MTKRTNDIVGLRDTIHAVCAAVILLCMLFAIVAVLLWQ